MKNEKTLSRTSWWRIGVRLSLVGVLSIMSTLVSILTTPSPVQAAECRVANPCMGCTHTSIQSAIDDAICDTIKVAQGTYNENLTVPGNRNVTLLGGYSTADWTTRSSASSTSINGSSSSNSVIRVSSDATIDNFTITGGSGRVSPSDGSTAGGGIYISGGTSTISNNIIQGNSAHYGGGLYLGGTGQPQILDNTISGNIAIGAVNTGWGGGLCILGVTPLIKGNTISNNRAYWGGGILVGQSRAIIEDNFITDNMAQGGDSAGGGIFSELAVPIIRNNVIARNTSQLYADGIYIKYLDSTHPGLQAQIINNTIVANKYSDSGTHEGIYVRGGVSPLIYNNIVALNGYGIRNYPYEPASPVLSNNDVWGNSVTDYSNLSPGTNDISADPLFVNQSGGDYHLQEGSPCIDAGTSTNAPTTDFEGDTRPLDGDNNGSALWDIGADEYKPTAWIDKQASPLSVDPGDTVIYTITYRNDSSSTATGVVITDLLPTGLINPTVTSSGANINLRGGTTYVWDVENLSPGSGGTIIIAAQVDPNVVTPTGILNKAEFDAVGIGSLSDDVSILVGGIDAAYFPLILKNFTFR